MKDFTIKIEIIFIFGLGIRINGHALLYLFIGVLILYVTPSVTTVIWNQGLLKKQ